jgi:protein phosphatase
MIDFHGETDVGRRRPHNEDTIFAAAGLFIVCDGMGGHRAGEVASRIATETIAAFVQRSLSDPDLTWPCGLDPALSDDANRLRNAIKLANQTVFDQSAASDEHRGMGTTVVAALVPSRGGELVYGHVGDSRLYLIRDGAIAQLTRDDSLGDQVSGAGAPLKNVLTKALGVQADVDFEVVGRDLRVGDTVLLCSDGLTNMLPDPAILEIVSAHGGNLKEACRRLVADANARGGRDNVSVVLVSCRS